MRGLVPAGFALAIRGLINAATAAAERPELDFEPLLIWLLAALAVTLFDALVPATADGPGDLIGTIGDSVLHEACGQQA